MSNKIKGNFSKKFQTTSISIRGEKPDWMDFLPVAPVNVLSKVNRPTKAKTLEKNLKQGGGFNWNLWSAPKVAKLPNGEMILYDGDHSRALYKMAFPNATHMPVALRSVDTIQEVHQLFHLENGGCRKNVSAEERFVHQYLSGDVKAVQTAENLKKCGLRVFCSDEDGGSVGNPTGPKTKYRGFEKSLSASSIHHVKHASEMIVNTFGTIDDIHSELLEGLSIVFNDYPEVYTDGVYEGKFRTWFSANRVNQQSAVSTSWKNDGGCVHNKQGASVARGIMQNFINKCSSPKPKLSLKRLASRGV